MWSEGLCWSGLASGQEQRSSERAVGFRLAVSYHTKSIVSTCTRNEACDESVVRRLRLTRFFSFVSMSFVSLSLFHLSPFILLSLLPLLFKTPLKPPTPLLSTRPASRGGAHPGRIVAASEDASRVCGSSVHAIEGVAKDHFTVRTL